MTALPRHIRADLIGRSDADLFLPAEHAAGLDIPDHHIEAALSSSGIAPSPRCVRAWRHGFAQHGRFLVAAAAVGAVHVSGEIA